MKKYIIIKDFPKITLDNNMSQEVVDEFNKSWSVGVIHQYGDYLSINKEYYMEYSEYICGVKIS